MYTGHYNILSLYVCMYVCDFRFLHSYSFSTYLMTQIRIRIEISDTLSASVSI